MVQPQLGAVPAEVKSSGMRKRGFTSFIERYRTKTGAVFPKGFSGLKEMRGARVAFLPHYFL